MSAVPRSVLSEALRTHLNGATLRAAVLTTFVLGWDFTVDEVLPTLVPHSLSAMRNARREELAEHLLSNGAALTVYADAAGIGDASGATRVPLAVVPVRHPTGYFHPKVLLALVVDDDQTERLVVAVGSANLTRRGWWESVECAHIWSIAAQAPTWCRDDLMSFIDQLGRHSVHPSDRTAPRLVRQFLAATIQRKRESGTAHASPERFVWNGAIGRSSFVDEVTALTDGYYRNGTLEICSPWYSDAGDAQVRQLSKALKVKQTVVLVPVGDDGRALMPEKAVTGLGDEVKWGALPRDVLSGGPTKEAKDRHVHAKAYRLTRPGDTLNTLIVGSFNLTAQAFHAQQNLEAAILVDVAVGGNRKWLEPIEPPTQFVGPEPGEAGELGTAALSPLRLTYDWAEHVAAASWKGARPTESVTVKSGEFHIVTIWREQLPGTLDDDQSAALRKHLQSSSPRLDVLSGAEVTYTFVVELNVEQKPSPDVTRRVADAVADMLLDDDSRRLRGKNGRGGEGADDGADEGPPAGVEPEPPSIFDTQAALFQALAAFGRMLAKLSEEGNDREIRYRLLGKGSRCLGDLLDASERTSEENPVSALVVLWGVEDLLSTCKPELKGHSKERLCVLAMVTKQRLRLESLLVAQNDHDPEMARFLQWARSTFNRVAS